jgi:hypothetical protein
MATDQKGTQLQGGAAAPCPAAYGLSPRCFNPSLPTRHAAGSSLHQRGEAPHPELSRSRRARFVPDEVVHRRSSRLLPGNHPIPEPGLLHVDEDMEEIR